MLVIDRFICSVTRGREGRGEEGRGGRGGEGEGEGEGEGRGGGEGREWRDDCYTYCNGTTIFK